MKEITLTLLLIVASILALPQPLINAEEEIIPAFDAIQDTVFLVFTRQNPVNGQIVHINDMSTVRNSYYDSRRPTIFLIHGMFGNRNNLINTIIQPAYLQAGDFSNFSFF